MIKLIVGVVVVIAVISGFVFITTNNKQADVVSSAMGAYCGSDGKLTDTKPIQSHRSYCVKSNASEISFTPNTPTTFSYSIIDDEGNTLKNLDTVHEKRMHFIVVRKDLGNFQHVHPEFNSTTGEFILANLNFPADGEYRLFADFTPSAGMKGSQGEKLPVTISQDIQVGAMASYKPLSIGNVAALKDFDGYQFGLTVQSQKPTTGSENMLTFDVAQNGKTITDLEQYLGALGHAVILSEEDLQFIHGHPVEDPTKPQTGEVNFMVSFPQAGKYKIFTQFQRQGKIITTDFVADVIEGSGTSLEVKHGGDSTTH